jgi:hypothetical protein
MNKNTMNIIVLISLNILSAQGSSFLDIDGNGLNDAWEVENFNQIGIDVGKDYDGDGQDSLHEMLAKTDPLVSTSRMDHTIFAGSTDVSVQFGPLVDERIYTVEKSDSLGGEWSVLTNGTRDVLGDYGAVQDASTTQCFYRVSIMDSETPDEGTTYYVSNSGDDNNDGLSQSNAWKTVSRVNDLVPEAGDSILFERGGTWRETLDMTASGTPRAYITYGAYGDGSRPRLLGSESGTNWVAVSGYDNVWQSSTAVRNPFDYYASEIWFVEQDGSVTWGSRKWSSGSSLDVLTAEYEATWDGDSSYNGLGTIYIYCEENPADRYAAVEIPSRDNIINLNDQEYVAVDGLELKYPMYRGIYESGTVSKNYLSGLRVTDCEIGYMGYYECANAYGLSLRRSNVYIGDSEIHNCGRRLISLHGYESVSLSCIMTNIVVSHCHFHDSFHSGFDSMNGGDHSISDLTLCYNFFEGNPDTQLGDDGLPNSNSLWISDDTQTDCISNIKVFGNLFTYAHGSACKITYVPNIEIYNNTFYCFNPTQESPAAGLVFLSDCENTKIYNNVFYRDTNGDVESTYPLECCLKKDDSMNDTLVIDNNLYWTTESDAWIIRTDGGSREHVRRNTWDDYMALGTFDQNSPDPSDPMFLNPSSNDFQLASTSAALDAGSDAGLFMDYNGVLIPRGLAPDIGAFESAYTFETDLEAPTSPTNLTALSSEWSIITLEWSNATDNVGVGGYYIYRNGTQVATTTSTEYTDSELDAGTTYSYTVVAVDWTGNLSEQSISAEVTTAADGELVLTASSYQDLGDEAHPPEDAVDNDPDTRWSTEGVGEWICFHYPQAHIFSSVSMSFFYGDVRNSYFDIEVSEDGQTWTQLYSGTSSGTTLELELFTFESTATTTWIRIAGGGNSDSTWNSYTEIEWGL